MASQSSERLAQLTAFDNTKTGVKGLVDAGVTTVPSFFMHTVINDLLLSETKKTTTLSVPTIDLNGLDTDPKRREDTVKHVKDALQTWGFFQVVNHGIPLEVLNEMFEGVRRFFEQDDEVKKRYYTRDFAGKKFFYNTNFDLLSANAANWRDTFSGFMAPTIPTPEELPTVCSEILLEYSNHVMTLGKILFELISETLGLQPSYLNDIHCTEGLQIVGHYYPACPQPKHTLGASPHTDGDFLTILLQDDIGGLQVRHDNQWFDVPPTPGALVINIGDLIQLITNDKFKSVLHRVVANTRGPRISIASFFTTGYQATNRVYGPIKEILSDSNPPRYRETTITEYMTQYINKGLSSTSVLQQFSV